MLFFKDPATLSGLMLSQSIALPITVMIMLTYSMQIAATSAHGIRNIITARKLKTTVFHPVTAIVG
jgi:hypothetical protein